MLRVVTRIEHFAAGAQSSGWVEPIHDSPDNLTDRSSFGAPALFSQRSADPADVNTSHQHIGGDSSYNLHASEIAGG